MQRDSTWLTLVCVSRKPLICFIHFGDEIDSLVEWTVARKGIGDANWLTRLGPTLCSLGVMERPTIILACDVLIVRTIAGVNAGLNEFEASGHPRRVELLQRTRAEIQARCVAEGDSRKQSGQWWASLPLVCDPSSLTNFAIPLAGLQKDLAAAERQLDVEEYRQPREWPFILAVLIAGCSAVPWIWYFILRRVRELSDAVRGR
jgi:hypothetical protein